MHRVTGRPTIPGMLAPSAGRALAVLLASVAAGGVLAACGTDEEAAYVDGWDAVCRDVGESLSDFRTAASSAATVSPDGGDAAVAAGPAPSAVTSDLGAASASLRADLQDAVAPTRELRPPLRWRTWHGEELRRLQVRLRTVEAGARRLRAGDPDALPLLAIGGVGPSSVRAPASLRDRTPECTALR